MATKKKASQPKVIVAKIPKDYQAALECLTRTLSHFGIKTKWDSQLNLHILAWSVRHVLFYATGHTHKKPTKKVAKKGKK